MKCQTRLAVVVVKDESILVANAAPKYVSLA